MCDLSSAIRSQLRKNPNKKMFRKSRDVLLEIAVKLEMQQETIKMLDHHMNLARRQGYEIGKKERTS